MRPPHLATLLLLTAAAWAAPRLARACSCLPPQPPAQAMKDSAAVFEARMFAQSPADHDLIRYEFEVSRVWKGDVAARAVVFSHKHGATCGRSYKVGVTYLVYARDQDGRLRDGLCSRTRPIDKAQEDLAVLGDGKPPADAAQGAGSGGPAPTEPPRVSVPEPTAQDGAPASVPAPAEPPPAEPSTRGCAVASPPTGAGALALLLVPLLARRRLARPRRRR